jgi:hypothetical protein
MCPKAPSPPESPCTTRPNDVSQSRSFLDTIRPAWALVLEYGMAMRVGEVAQVHVSDMGNGENRLSVSLLDELVR